MRGLEIAIGVLLVASGLTDPVGTTHLAAGLEGPAAGTLHFPEWDYSGAATVHSSQAAVHATGPFEAIIVGALTLEVREVSKSGWDLHVPSTDVEWSHRMGPSQRVHMESYDDVRIRVAGNPDAILVAWPDATLPTADFGVALDHATNATVRPVGGSVAWTTTPMDRFLMGAPLFAVGDGGPPEGAANATSVKLKEFVAHGGFQLVIKGGATLFVDQDGDAQRHSTWTRDGLSAGVPAAGIVAADEDRYALVTVRDAEARMDLEGVKSALITRNATWSINGLLGMTARDGVLALGDEERPVADDRLQMVGNTTMRTQAIGDGDLRRQIGDVTTPTVTEESDREVFGEIARDADGMWVNGEPVGRDAPAPPALPAQVTLLAKILGFLVLAWSGARWLGIVLVGKGRQDPLAHPRRREIHSFLARVGVSHLREVERATGIPVASLSHHLEVLRQAGYVQCLRHGNRRVLFLPSPDKTWDDMKRLALLADSTRRDIAKELASGDRLSQGDLGQMLGISQPSVARQLSRLVGAGLVERRGDRDAEYTAAPLLKKWWASRTGDPT